MNSYCTNCGIALARNNKFCQECGAPIKSKGRRLWFWIIVVLVLLALVVTLVLSLEDNGIDGLSLSDPFSSEDGVEEIMKEFVGQELDLSGAAIASVVNVICPYAGNEMSFDANGEGGSGVVLDGEGVIITNSHVIPQDSKGLDINEEGCIVLFPDTKTGQPMQAYFADPIVIPGLSDDYDLAMLIIRDVYKDRSGYAYGKYPNTFPAVSDEGCEEEDIKLGEKVTVYGYPSVTGGYSLTVTEGVVSSFSPYGVVVSAKIDLGNSGGLAVDKKGCFMGVPTLVNYGDAESYGVIIPSGDVVEFINQLSSLGEEEP